MQGCQRECVVSLPCLYTRFWTGKIISFFSIVQPARFDDGAPSVLYLYLVCRLLIVSGSTRNPVLGRLSRPALPNLNISRPLNYRVHLNQYMDLSVSHDGLFSASTTTTVPCNIPPTQPFLLLLLLLLLLILILLLSYPPHLPRLLPPNLLTSTCRRI